MLMPADAGTGVIAGAAVRAVCEAAGIKNVITKSFGTSNQVTVVKADDQGPAATAHAAGRRTAAGSYR